MNYSFLAIQDLFGGGSYRDTQTYVRLGIVGTPPIGVHLAETLLLCGVGEVILQGAIGLSYRTLHATWNRLCPHLWKVDC